jgi:hypothetical protein
MGNDIKGLLDGIISDTKGSYPGATEYRPNAPQFDRGEFRNKLSMMVLKDLVAGMLRDECPVNFDSVLENIVGRQLQNGSYNGAYDYIMKSRDTLNSPTLGGIIQEIDGKVESVAKQVTDTKDVAVADQIDIKEVLKKVKDYDEFRDEMKEIVSEKVKNDVVGVITSSNDAPTFKNVDDEMAKISSEDATQESFILKMAGKIVQEHAIAKDPIDMDSGVDIAIMEYVVEFMNREFKQYIPGNIYDMYIHRRY